MADEQAAPEPMPVNNLTATQSFYRILYNGNWTNRLNTKLAPVNFANIQGVFECAITMAQENIELPIAAIKKVYQKKTYWDVQYIIAALAYCAKQNHVPELKEAAYQTASELINNQTDFLLFVKCCRTISHHLNNLENASTINNPDDNPQGYGGAGFGRGMRKMALRWYGKYDPVQLANMFGEHRGMCRMTHRRLIIKAHLRTDGDKPRFKKNRKQKNQNNCAGASTSQNIANNVPVPSTSSAAEPEANVAAENLATTENNDPVPSTSSAIEPEKNVLAENLATTTEPVAQVVAHESDQKHKLGPGAKRLKLVQNLKTNLDIETNVAADNLATTENNDPVPSTSSAVESGPNVVVENLATAPEPVVQVIAHETDRNHVFEFIMMNGTNYIEFLKGIPELGPGAQRMQLLQNLKTNMDIENAVKSITPNKFSVDQMPAHLLECKDIWKILLPDMTIRQCLDYFHTIRGFTFLNPGEAIANIFIQQLELKKDQLKNGDICPIELFILKRVYDNNARYLSKAKADWYQKKVDKRNILVNNLLQSHLGSYFNLALSGVTMKSSTKFFVTIDLRMGNQKKHVARNKHIYCTEASILLAYSMYERAKDVSIYTFSGTENGDLVEIHPHLKHDNFEHAKQICEQKTSAKTFQSLSEPIAHATKQKEKVDVFVVIVDSVARFCRQGRVPQREFAEYKAKFNAHAKFLVVNLARLKHDLVIPSNEEMTGFFEVCGFNESTPKIINALATHSLR